MPQDNFTLPPLSEVTSADQAEELAKDWQIWAGENSLSYGELAEYQSYFETLAAKFDLTEVFQENGII